MSDPIICIECGATSYNEPGKTPIRCASCWEKLKARAEKAERLLDITRDSLETYAEFYSKAASLAGLSEDCLPSSETDLHILKKIAEWDEIEVQKARAERAEARLAELEKSYAVQPSETTNWSAEEILKREG